MKTDGMLELYALTPDALTPVVGGSGRARAVWRALVSGGDPYRDPALSSKLRARLEERTRAIPSNVERRERAGCGTTKLRLALADGTRIETVLIPSARRSTVCVSTQAGCARGCRFCVTATMGLERNLTPGEIVGQVLAAVAEARRGGHPPVTNVVYMGMGEPLDNYEAVAQSIAVLCAPNALGLGPAHVTLSTVGTHPAAIRRTGEMTVQLAWSLHAVDDEVRRRLVPTARHSTRELRQAFVERFAVAGGSLFAELTLMDGVNDAPGDAEALADFLRPFPGVRVNLLPMNAGREGLRRSPAPRVAAFRERLQERGVFCVIRRPRGTEAHAACGQLAV